jgi:hypothetical protein
MDNNLYLLDYKENASALFFYKEINSLEFVDLIRDMPSCCSVDYVKRDLYLKNIGYKMFKLHKQKKYKRRKIKINFNHEIKYISGKASENRFKQFIKRLFSFNIVININTIKFQKYSNYIDNLGNSNFTLKVLSQDEIDKLLTAINSDTDEIEN